MLKAVRPLRASEDRSVIDKAVPLTNYGWVPSCNRPSPDPAIIEQQELQNRQQQQNPLSIESVAR